MEINDGAFIISSKIDIHPAALIMPPMSDDEFNEFKQDILGNGLLEPIILFQGKILDGRNRYNACREVGIDVWCRHWEGGMDPVEYVVSKNIHRRQLTAGQRAAAAAKALEYHTQEAKERQRDAGRLYGEKHPKQELVAPAQQAENEPEFERKAISKAGNMLKVSGRTVAGAKLILDHGTEDEKRALETGTIAVKPLEKQVRERIQNAPRTTKATFNQTTDSIEWAKWTWNPVTGCKHGCPYCYARDITNRYPDAFPNGFEPTFYPDRLDAPQNTKLPASENAGSRNVFVCSMADLFGDWVSDEWIYAVLSACDQAQDWTFIFLTKNPSRLCDFDWPENAWVGTTVDCQERVVPAIDAFNAMQSRRPSVCFVSCEPMTEPLYFGSDGLSVFDWLIIGGRSSSAGMPAMQPSWGWVESLHYQARKADCKVYWKPNLTVRPREYPDPRHA